MFTISNAANFRRTVAGCCLIIASPILAVGVALLPDYTTDSATELAQYAAQRGQALAGGLLTIAFALVFVPGLFGVLHRIRGRGVVYGHVAALLLTFGSIMTVVMGTIQLLTYEMTAPGLDRASMARLLDAVNNDHAITLPMVLGTNFLFSIGLILLGVAVWRSHVAPWWSALAVILFPVLGYLPGGLAALAGSFAVGAVGFGVIGARLLTCTDADWDQTPVPARSSASETVPLPA